MSNAHCCKKYVYEGEHEPTCITVMASQSNAAEPKAEQERRLISDEDRRAFARELASLQDLYAAKSKPKDT